MGDLDLEWAFLKACNVLYEPFINDLDSAFNNGLHGICGFHSTSVNTPTFGELFAKYLTGQYLGGPRCIGDAWKLAARYDQPSDTWPAIYRAKFSYGSFLDGLLE